MPVGQPWGSETDSGMVGMTGVKTAGGRRGPVRGGGCLRGEAAENDCDQPVAENLPEKPWS
jgi:hypothetical protein